MKNRSQRIKGIFLAWVFLIGATIGFVCTARANDLPVVKDFIGEHEDEIRTA